MKSALIVSSSEKAGALFKEMLVPDAYCDIFMAGTGTEARRLMMERPFDLCIINAPLKDEFGTDLAVNIAVNTLTQVILIVKSQLADEISAKVEDHGIYVLPKPFSRQLFWSALKLAAATRNKLLGLRNENEMLQKKIEDIKYIDRAKCLLIENFKITEAEAHRIIEKRAMDMRITRREVAAAILKMYEG